VSTYLTFLYGFGLPLVEKMHFFEDSVTKKNKIRAHELLSSLRNVSNIGDVKKLLSKAQKRTKLLETPLPRNISDKVIIIILLTNCR
jgi:hypothetical protein